MVHFIIINWFDWSGIWIWNWCIVRLNCKLSSGNFNITIIYGTMINFTHDSWNHRVGYGRRGPVFEVSFWRLAVPFYWCLFWFVIINCIELIHISPKTWWELFWTTDDACISFVSNSSTSFTNTLFSRAEIWNKWMDSFCVIVAGRWRTKIIRALTWSGQCCWSSNHL